MLIHTGPPAIQLRHEHQRQEGRERNAAWGKREETTGKLEEWSELVLSGVLCHCTLRRVAKVQSNLLPGDESKRRILIRGIKEHAHSQTDVLWPDDLAANLVSCHLIKNLHLRLQMCNLGNWWQWSARYVLLICDWITACLFPPFFQL